MTFTTGHQTRAGDDGQVWKRSWYSDSANSCVWVTRYPSSDDILVRDEHGNQLTFTPKEFGVFIAEVRDGGFDDFVTGRHPG